MASITYEFQDPSTGFRATCLVEETGDGTLLFTISVDESTGTVGDLRGLFFDMNRDDQTFLNSLEATGEDVTDDMFKKDSVTNLGDSSNVNGEVVNETGKFDAGVEFGSAGLKRDDDIQWTQFTLSSSLCALTLDMLTSVDTALRVTSVGDEDGSRNGSLKLVGDLSSGVISGFYFWDKDNDDVDSDGDTGIAGKWVTLYNADGTAALDAAGNTVAAVRTAPDGSYMFANVAAGDYVVAFEDSSDEGLAWVAPNVGTDEAIDSDVDPATGRTGMVTVVAGCETTDVDAGVKAPPAPPSSPSSIAGRYFDDANGNGFDDGEAGVVGRTVTLLDDQGIAVATTLTDGTGGYSFGDLAAGSYAVHFESTDGKVFSAKDAGGDDSVDSDVDPATGLTDTVGVVAGEDLADVDAGVITSPPQPPGGEEGAWDLTGTIRTEAHSLTFIMDASFSTYDWFLGTPPVDINLDGINNVIDAMLAAVIERAQGLAPDQRIDLVLAGGDGVLGQQTVYARDLHGLDPHAPVDAAALQAIFEPVFDQPAGLPDDVDFASALAAAGSAIQAGHGAAGALKDQVILLTTSDGIDGSSLPAHTGYAEAAQALVAALAADIDVMLIESMSLDYSVLSAIDSDGVIDSYSSIFDDPFNPLPDPYMLETLVSDSPAVTEADILGLLVGGERFAFTDPSNGDGRIDVALTGLEADPAAGIGVEIDTDQDGVADTVVAASLEFIDGAWHFEVGPADLLV